MTVSVVWTCGTNERNILIKVNRRVVRMSLDRPDQRCSQETDVILLEDKRLYMN